jgi:hypothetical protein
MILSSAVTDFEHLTCVTLGAIDCHIFLRDSERSWSYGHY